MIRAVLYARYSSDKQREASIEDQARNCRRIAEREGWQLGQTYQDQAVSGSRADRAGYQSMLADAKAGKFDVLLIDDISRLSRDQVEAESTFRRLEHWGVRIIGVADGYDSEAKTRKVHRAVKNLMNEVYLDDLAEKTHRGLEGQARAGNNAGGHAYGYRHVPIEDPERRDVFGRPIVVAVRREIEPTQAEIVRSIFDWYATGYSPRWIADELNRLQVPSPGANWQRKTRRRDGVWLASAIAGDVQKGIGILNNDLYRGLFIWNRSHWLRDPETHRRVRRERPNSEWIAQNMPHLRIVSDERWQSVKARQADVRGKSVKIRQALHRTARPGRDPKYLLSGMLKCGVCGANFVIGDKRRYVCASHVNGGRHACTNYLRVGRVIAESKILAGIKAELLAPEYLDEFKREFRALRAAQHSARKSTLEARRVRLAELEQEIGHLIKAVAKGLLSPTVKARLESAESERATILSDRGGQSDQAPMEFLPRLADTYGELVDNLERIPDRHIPRARASLRGMTGGSIRLIPDAKMRALTAEISLDGCRLLEMACGQKINVVAGAGFEPATFGL